MERVGILGLPQSGKTTLFEVLVQGAGAQAASTSGREQVAVIVVPDERELPPGAAAGPHRHN